MEDTRDVLIFNKTKGYIFTLYFKDLIIKIEPSESFYTTLKNKEEKCIIYPFKVSADTFNRDKTPYIQNIKQNVNIIIFYDGWFREGKIKLK